MRTRRLIKRFPFSEPERKNLTLDDGVRLDPLTHRLKLETDDAGRFNTGPNLFARTRLTEPARLVNWTSFQSVDVKPTDEAGAAITRVQFRLSDGTSDYFWNGSAWVVVGANDWSPEADVANNISTFLSTVTSRKLQVVVNLDTDDERFSPEVVELRVLYQTDVEPQEDVIIRSLIPELRSGLRPIMDYIVKPTTLSTTIDISDGGAFALEAPFNIVDVDSVFDLTDDPDRFTDLAVSFDVPSQVVTLSSAPPTGNRVLLRLVYEPEVAIDTSGDFVEVAKVPAVVIEDVDFVDATEISVDDIVVNRSTGDAVVVPAPLQGDLEVLLSWQTDTAVDHQRLGDELKRFFGNRPTLRTKGTDEEYRLWLVDEYDQRGDANRQDIRRGQLTFRIVGVLIPFKDARDTKAVLGLRLRVDTR